MKHLLPWIIILLTIHSHAQVLNVRKGYSYKTALKLVEGDSVGYILYNDKESYGGIIHAIGDSSIFIGDRTIAYTDISVLIVRRTSGFRRFLHGIPFVIYKFSLYYFIYGNLNAWRVNLWTPEYLKRHSLITAGMVSGTWTLQLLEQSTQHKKYKIHKKYRLVPVIFPT